MFSQGTLKAVRIISWYVWLFCLQNSSWNSNTVKGKGSFDSTSGKEVFLPSTGWSGYPILIFNNLFWNVCLFDKSHFEFSCFFAAAPSAAPWRALSVTVGTVGEHGVCQQRSKPARYVFGFFTSLCSSLTFFFFFSWYAIKVLLLRAVCHQNYSSKKYRIW